MMNQVKQNEKVRALKVEITRLKRGNKDKDYQLEAKKQELKRCLYTVSHELKTPIISMRGFCSLLCEYHFHELDEEGQEYLERVNKNIEQMERLVDDLLEFSRIEILEKEYEEVEISQVLDEALTELQFLLERNQIDLITNGRLPRIYCHKNKLIQVFTNLISNSIKYADEKRKLRIEIGYIENEIFHKFYVKDNGVGIPPRGRKKLFQMFTRLGNKKGAEGTGLGLAIVKKIVEGHGGEIWVNSKRGKGTTFFLTLPRNNRAKG